ncbi:MAG: hypothetical protein E3K37_02460 [Candidatus Kuenenia sp.]|nr:hypothetical protein [Candidatus Kuenenia hertensis]
MENVMQRLTLAKQHTSLCKFDTFSFLFRILSAPFEKLKRYFLLVKEFIECPAFYQGEITNTAPYEARITLIKNLNNK